MAKVKTAYPDYAKLADPGPASLPELTRQLHKGEAFLSFVVGTYGAFALLVTQDGLTLAPVELDHGEARRRCQRAAAGARAAAWETGRIRSRGGL